MNNGIPLDEIEHMKSDIVEMNGRMNEVQKDLTSAEERANIHEGKFNETKSDLDQTKALMSDIAAPSRFIILVADTNSRAVSGSWADTKNVYAGYMLVIKRNVERDGFQMTVNEDIIAKITKAVKSTLIY